MSPSRGPHPDILPEALTFLMAINCRADKLHLPFESRLKENSTWAMNYQPDTRGKKSCIVKYLPRYRVRGMILMILCYPIEDKKEKLL